MRKVPPELLRRYREQSPPKKYITLPFKEPPYKKAIRAIVSRFKDTCETKLHGTYKLEKVGPRFELHACELPDPPEGGKSEFLLRIEEDPLGRSFRRSYEYRVVSKEMYTDPDKLEDLNIKILKETGRCYVDEEYDEDIYGEPFPTGHYNIVCESPVYTGQEPILPGKLLKELEFIRDLYDSAFKKAMEIAKSTNK